MRAAPHVLDPERGRGRSRPRRTGPSISPSGAVTEAGDGDGRIVHLRIENAAHQAPTRSTATDLWDAWQSLDDWEATAGDELGASLGELLLVLWTVHRLGSSSEGRAALDDLIDDDLHPTFDNPLLEDVVGVSFALGAAWAARRALAHAADNGSMT
jgi:hypothetical protein